MDMKPVLSNSAPSEPQKYTFSIQSRAGEKSLEVASDKIDLAKDIDLDENRHLSDREIKTFLRKQDILRDPAKLDVDEDKIIREYKYTLQGKELPQTGDYHSYTEMVDEMKAMTAQHKDICEMVKIGTSHEGRDIWALKIGKPSEKEGERKPGVVITGLTHAREWIGGEAALTGAKSVVENYNSDPKMKNRVDNAEIWYIPCANPDGYEFSRSTDNWWRKNRHDYSKDPAGAPKPLQAQPMEFNIAGKPGETSGTKASWWGGGGEAIGADLNRNYYDGNPDHLELYRPPTDTPGTTADDQGASDDVTDETYRGPMGGSENEIKALQNLELDNKNIKAAIDFHAYGNLILYPWGFDYKKHEKIEEYKAVGNTMQKIIADSDNQHVQFKVQQSADMYPANGSSEDFQGANDILGFTLELGRSFQPSGKEAEAISKRVLGAQMYLIDYVIENGAHMRPEKPAQKTA